MKFKRILKITLKAIVFLTLPSILFLGFLYFKYDTDLPVGKAGIEADALANKMLNALNYEAFKTTSYIEWTYKNRRHYNWQKDKNICTVYWKTYKVVIQLNDYDNSIAYVHNFKVDGNQADELIQKAIAYFNNDSFWLVAPYKIFDPGTERKVVLDENNNEALLVNYTTGGTTPGDTYLWQLDENGRPVNFKMWVSSIPIGGLEASWSDWTTTKSGALLPLGHSILFFGIDLGEVKATN